MEAKMDAQWGSWLNPPDFGFTIAAAEGALRARGYQVFINAQQGGFFVIGGKDGVVVTVACTPGEGGTSTVVVATSDTAAAEAARNDIRATIQGTATL
jgi:hypothetical protein